MAHVLNSIGIRTYHSEDMLFYSWREYCKTMRLRPEYQHLDPGWLAGPLSHDPLAHQELAMSMSRCRVKGIAFDGLEALIRPVWDLSPDIKVIITDWRTYAQFKKSATAFGPKLSWMILLNLWSGAHTTVLPWSSLLKVWDPILGSPIERAIQDGGPAITEVSGPLMHFYHNTLNHYNQHTTFYAVGPGAVASFPTTEEHYDAFYRAVKEVVPPDRLMSCNPGKTTFEDLCAFLDIHPCPAKGKLPKAINTWVWERDFPVSNFMQHTVKFFLMWVNWKLLLGALGLLTKLLRLASPKKHEKAG